MSRRFLLLFSAPVVLLMPIAVDAQDRPSGATAAAANAPGGATSSARKTSSAKVSSTAPSGTGSSNKAWKQGRTLDGQPDLEGVWTNPTITPFERPVELAGKAFL